LSLQRIARNSLLSVVALTIFLLEAQIPLPLPIPGLRLGLSNMITVYALAAFGKKDALAIVLVRILLGNIFSGQLMALFYALGGGLLSFSCMALVLPKLNPDQLWVSGVIGGLSHNLGQMGVAVAITQTPGLLVYLPVLLLCGIITGAFTGLCAQLLKNRLKLY